MTYILYTPATSLYSKASLTASPWGSDATDLVETQAGLFDVDAAAPYIFVGTAGAAASTDDAVGVVGDIIYGDIIPGDLFVQQRLHAWDWENAGTLDKLKALYYATQLINQFNFIGCKTVSTQYLEFPRTRVDANDVTQLIGGTALIPVEIEEAAYLIADALLSGRDPELDFESLRAKVETFGPVRTEFATGVGPPEHMANLIPSPAAWAKIKPFVEISTSFDVIKG